MTNEAYAIFMLFVSLGSAMLFYKLGNIYLTGFIMVAILTANLVGPKIFHAFNMDVTPGIFMFSGIFLATDLLAEKYGKQIARRAVLVSFAGMCLFVLLTQLTLQISALPFTQDVSHAMALLFDTSPRIFLASIIAYIIWQNIDIWLYHTIHKKTQERLLWLRNNVSTIISSTGSVFTFFFLAFAGTEANWVKLALSGAVIYWVIAILDTPFMYASKKITPLDIKA